MTRLRTLQETETRTESDSQSTTQVEYTSGTYALKKLFCRSHVSVRSTAATVPAYLVDPVFGAISIRDIRISVNDSYTCQKDAGQYDVYTGREAGRDEDGRRALRVADELCVV
jgi:hypothetical protein